MSFGLAGIAVLFNPLFLCGSAPSGGLYFGTAGLGHIRSVKTNREEVFSMVTDLIAFLMIEGCLVIHLLKQI